MEGEILYSEKQRFNQWWLWIILLGSNGIIAYGVLVQIIFNKQFGDKPASNAELLIVFAFTILMTIGFYILRLETIIKTDGIYVKFFPFHTSFKRYSWDNIQKSYVRQYKPIGEYGGWGFRGIGKNRALNVSGNQGLQLELEGDKKLLIGTRKPEEVIEILRKSGRQ